MPRTREALLGWRNIRNGCDTGERFRKSNLTVFSAVSTEHHSRASTRPGGNTSKIAEVKGFHFHDLRHTFCSNLLLSGSDLKDVKEMIGHKDLAMTDRYSHLTLNISVPAKRNSPSITVMVLTEGRVGNT